MPSILSEKKIGIIDAVLICAKCGQKIKLKHLKCQKEKREKLISDIQTDLDELVEWCKYLPVDSEINIRLGRKVEKWEKKK